jgi:hypothetical protein
MRFVFLGSPHHYRIVMIASPKKGRRGGLCSLPHLGINWVSEKTSLTGN